MDSLIILRAINTTLIILRAINTKLITTSLTISNIPTSNNTKTTTKTIPTTWIDPITINSMPILLTFLRKTLLMRLLIGLTNIPQNNTKICLSRK